MSEFAHSWKGADHDNVRKKCNEGQAQRQWKNKMERIKRIQGGQIQEDDRGSLIRYHRDAMRRGEFRGSLEKWLSIHRVTLPPPSSRSHRAPSEDAPDGGIISQSLADATVKISGPEVLWGLMVIAGQLPLIPSPTRNAARLLA